MKRPRPLAVASAVLLLGAFALCVALAPRALRTIERVEGCGWRYDVVSKRFSREVVETRLTYRGAPLPATFAVVGLVLETPLGEFRFEDAWRPDRTSPQSAGLIFTRAGEGEDAEEDPPTPRGWARTSTPFDLPREAADGTPAAPWPANLLAKPPFTPEMRQRGWYDAAGLGYDQQLLGTPTDWIYVYDPGRQRWFWCAPERLADLPLK